MNISIINLLTTYEFPAIFFGAFFFGETVILTASFLAGEGTWSVGTVFWLSLFGTLISDSLWFLLGRAFLKFTRRWERYQSKYDNYLLHLEKLTGGRPFLALLFIKFLYGTRILTIIYLSIRRLNFSKFLIFNIIGTTIWLFVVVLIGWLVGRGVVSSVKIFSRVELVITVLVLLVLGYRLITSWISKKIIEE